MAKSKTITLDCGFEADMWKSGNIEFLCISIIGLYNGYGAFSSLKDYAALFAELDKKGYGTRGISRVEGYYGSTDDLLLDVSKTTK